MTGMGGFCFVKAAHNVLKLEPKLEQAMLKCITSILMYTGSGLWKSTRPASIWGRRSFTLLV